MAGIISTNATLSVSTSAVAVPFPTEAGASRCEYALEVIECDVAFYLTHDSTATDGLKINAIAAADESKPAGSYSPQHGALYVVAASAGTLAYAWIKRG